MKIKNRLKLIISCLLVLSVVGCTPWRKYKVPDFGEDGFYCPSEKVTCYLGGNAGGLSNEEYLARADAAWGLGVFASVYFDRELFKTAPQEGLSDEENAVLVRAKERIEKLENPSDQETGEILMEAYLEFFGWKEWAKDWTKFERYARGVRIYGCFRPAKDLDLTRMVKAAESPLIQGIFVEPHGIVQPEAKKD